MKKRTIIKLDFFPLHFTVKGYIILVLILGIILNFLSCSTAPMSYRAETDRQISQVTAKWKAVEVKFYSGYKDICFGDSNHGWAIADHECRYTSDGGKTWSPQFIDETMASIDMESIDFITPLEGWIVGSNKLISHTDNLRKMLNTGKTKIEGEITESNKLIFHTSDGGVKWVSQKINTKDRLKGVDFINSACGWVIGDAGIIFHTTDGGSTWVTQESGVKDNLKAIYFINADIGWVIGQNGTILYTKDGGNKWMRQNSNIRYDALNGISFIGTDKGWIVGQNGIVLHTDNGGNKWIIQKTGIDVDLTGVDFINSNEGWVVGYKGIILHTYDGGITWTPESSNTDGALMAIDFTNSDNGCAVGINGILEYAKN